MSILVPAATNNRRSCPCRKPYMLANTVTNVTVVSRYSIAVCPLLDSMNLFITFLSVTAVTNLVNTLTLKIH